MTKQSNSSDKNNSNAKSVGKSVGNKRASCEDGRHAWWHWNRKTLPLKITLFLYYGAMAAILPYLTIHMKDIGISLSQIAIIYAVLPFTAFLGPPIMGFMADKLGQYKAVLIVATVINGVSHSLLLTVPKYSETPLYSQAIIQISAGSNQNPTASLQPVHASLCSQFITSLKYRQQQSANNEHPDNSVINVHSCSWNNSNNNATGPPLSRGIVQRWQIPSLCQHSVEHQSIICGTGRTRISRSVASTSCSASVHLDDILPKPETEQQVTCQTNYTFPSGERMAHGNGPLTFWLYFFIRIVGNLFMSVCFSLLDATTLAVVKQNSGAEYGKERILSVVGFALVSPFAGLLVDTVSQAKGHVDYSSAFYVANAMLIMNIIGYLFMKLDVEKPEKGMWKNATQLLNYPEVILFLAMIFIMGNMWGFVESYLFIFLDELEAPKYLLGLTLTVGSLVSVPFLYGAEGIVAKAGRVNIIVLAFIFYFIRCFGYSYIPNPFWCFPFEAMEAFTYHLMWVAAATYCSVIAPKGLLGTLTGVMGSLHYGLGKGNGAFIGGYVINMSSTRLAFRYFGVVAGVMGVVYFLINKLWLEGAIRRRNEQEEQQMQDTEQGEAMLRKTRQKTDDNTLA